MRYPTDRGIPHMVRNYHGGYHSLFLLRHGLGRTCYRPRSPIWFIPKHNSVVRSSGDFRKAFTWGTLYVPRPRGPLFATVLLSGGFRECPLCCSIRWSVAHGKARYLGSGLHTAIYRRKRRFFVCWFFGAYVLKPRKRVLTFPAGPKLSRWKWAGRDAMPLSIESEN